MVSVLFLASLFLAFVSFRKKRLRRPGLRGVVLTQLWYHTFEFCCILSVVLLFYHVLFLVATLGWRSISVERLVRMDQLLRACQSFIAARVTLGWERTLLILLVIYVLGMFHVRMVESGSVSVGFRRLRKCLHVANIALLLLCAFTIVGQEVGTPAVALELHIRDAKQEYGACRNAIKQSLADQTVGAINNRIIDQLPKPYQQVGALSAKRDEASATLRKNYLAFQAYYHAKDQNAELLLRNEETKRVAQERIAQVFKEGPTSNPETLEAQPPPTASYRQIRQAREAIDSQQSEFRRQMAEFWSSPGGKDLLTHLPKFFTSKLPPAAVRLISDAHPEIAPMVEIVSETINDTIKNQIDSAIDNLALKALNTPDTVGNSIDATAKEIGNAVTITVTPQQAKAATQQINRLQAEIETTAKAVTTLTKQGQALENAKFDRLLTELQSSSATQREAAVEALSRDGAKMSETHAQRLIEIMRNGNQRWQTGASRPPGHHCTDYEYTSVRYYAGKALQRIESSYITSNIKTEASRAESEGKHTERVTDPGWI